MIVHGQVDAAFESVAEAFRMALVTAAGGGTDAGESTGAALAVWSDGAWVVDLWGGAADAAGTRRGSGTAIVQPYSTTKPFAAMCALLLVDRGLLDLDAPVQSYWPEFQPAASVRQVLSHQAGVVVLDEEVPTDTFYDGIACVSCSPDRSPRGRRALGLVSPPCSTGIWSGRSFGVSMGAPPASSCGRRSAARWNWRSPLGSRKRSRHVAADLTFDNDQFRRVNAEGRPELFRRAISNPYGAEDVQIVNSKAWRAAEIPAVNGHGTARGVAGLYAALLRGELLSSDLLQEATSVVGAGEDQVIGEHVEWGLGFGVDDDGFGMGGIGGSVGAASTRGNYAFAFMPGAIGTFDRAEAIEGAIRETLGLPPLE